MCGRYYIQDDMLEGIGRMVEKVDTDVKEGAKTGEIFPTNEVPLIIGRDGDLVLTKQGWGYPGFAKGQTIINARSETVLERKTFQGGIRHRRAIIPMSYYFEWNKEKEKIEFHPNEGRLLFVASIYDLFDEKMHFTMLTRAAVEGMEDVHHRMPLILGRDQVEDWIMDEGRAKALLTFQPQALRREYECQQLRMDTLLS